MSFNVSYIANEEIGIQQKGSKVMRGVLHENSTTASSGQTLSVDGMGTATITIRGSFMARIKFEARANSQSAWSTITGIRRDNLSAVTETRRGGNYVFDVSGLLEIRAVIVEIRSGSVYVEGSTTPTVQSLQPTQKTEEVIWEVDPNSGNLMASSYWKQEKPFLNIRILHSQGLVYLKLEEELEFGGLPKTIKKFYANNEVYKFNVAGMKYMRLSARPAYRGADGITLDNIKIVVWGSN